MNTHPFTIWTIGTFDGGECGANYPWHLMIPSSVRDFLNPVRIRYYTYHGLHRHTMKILIDAERYVREGGYLIT